MNSKEEASTIQSFLELGLCLVICITAAVFGAMFLPGEWYENLLNPPWTPPDHVFSWVWSLLYIMMGSAVWIVWRNRGVKGVNLPLMVFLLQLILNVVWAYLFFELHRLDIALVDAGLLLVVVFVTVILFWKKSALAGLFLIPYLLWMFFAVFLNFTIWRLNG